MQSYFLNGGMIGSTLDLESREIYGYNDPFYANVSLLLSGGGPNDSTMFVDLSPSPRSIDVSGNARYSTSITKYSPSSIFFDGSGDFLRTAYSRQLDLLVGSFTVEAWIYPTTTKTNQRIFCTGGGAVGWSSTTGIHVLFQITSTTNNLALSLSSNTTTPRAVISTGTIPTNAWTHVAATFNGTTGVSLFINGVQETFTITAPLRPSTNPTTSIGTVPGEDGSSTTAFAGYIEDLRVTKGVVRYTANFTPPTQSFLSQFKNQKNSGIWSLTALYEQLYNQFLTSQSQSLVFSQAVVVGGTTTTTHTCTAVNPQANRLVIAAIAMGGATSSSISGVTIGGVTATRRAGRTASDFVQTDFWSAIVPAGTSLDVLVTRNAGTNTATVILITASGYANTNWLGGTDFDANNSSTALMDVTLSPVAGSTVIGFYAAENIQETASRVWSGVNTFGFQRINPEIPGTLGSVAGDINLQSIYYQSNVPAGSRTVSFTSSDTTRRRPTFAVIAFT